MEHLKSSVPKILLTLSHRLRVLKHSFLLKLNVQKDTPCVNLNYGLIEEENPSPSPLGDTTNGHFSLWSKFLN
jgi:hypothetical protein